MGTEPLPNFPEIDLIFFLLDSDRPETLRYARIIKGEASG